MSEIRLFELRQCAGFVRHAREALRSGDLQKAVRYAKMVTRGLYFVRGIASGRGTGATLGTAGLTSVLDNLWDAIGEALRPAPRVEPWELVDEIAAGIRILQTRDGVDVTDEQVRERARNIATALTDRWKFVALENPQVAATPGSSSN